MPDNKHATSPYASLLKCILFGILNYFGMQFIFLLLFKLSHGLPICDKLALFLYTNQSPHAPSSWAGSQPPSPDIPTLLPLPLLSMGLQTFSLSHNIHHDLRLTPQQCV